MPDICFKCEQKKTYLQFLRHLIFQFGIVCLCFLTASHKVSGLILLDDGSSYSFMSIMIFFFLQNLSKCTRQSACSRIGRHISILCSTYNRIVSQPLPCCVRRRGSGCGAVRSVTPLAAVRRRWWRRQRIVAAQSALRISMPRLPSLFFTLNGNTEGKYSNNATIDSRLATRANYYTNVY